MKLVNEELREQTCGTTCHPSRFAVQPNSGNSFASLKQGASSFKPKSDKVLLSPFAKELNQSLQWIDQVPEIRLEMVNSLRQKIAEGNYHPDEQIIAANMIGEALANQISAY